MAAPIKDRRHFTRQPFVDAEGRKALLHMDLVDANKSGLILTWALRHCRFYKGFFGMISDHRLRHHARFGRA
jgi:hypothetical protein